MSNPSRAAKKLTPISKPVPTSGELERWLSGYSPYVSYGQTGPAYSGSSCATAAGYQTASEIMNGTAGTFVDVNAAVTSVELGTATSIPTGATYTTIAGWDAPAASPHLALGQVQTGNLYKVPFTMSYGIGAQVTFDASGNNNAGYRALRIVLKRGITEYIIGQKTVQPEANSAIDTSLEINTVVNCLFGDEILVRVAQTGGASLPLATGVRTRFYVQPRDKPIVP